MFDLQGRRRVRTVHSRRRVVTGHSYIVYGPLANGAAQVMYGEPRHPNKGRWWEIVEVRRHLLYTAPTAIRTFMKWGNDIPGVRPVVDPPAGQRR